MALSENLLKLRKEKRLTQQELADALEIGQVAYSHYERGRNFPTEELLSSFADFFEVSTDYLLGRTNIRNLELNKDVVALQMSEEMEKLPPEAIAELKQYTEFIKSKYANRDKEKES